MLYSGYRRNGMMKLRDRLRTGHLEKDDTRTCRVRQIWAIARVLYWSQVRRMAIYRTNGVRALWAITKTSHFVTRPRYQPVVLSDNHTRSHVGECKAHHHQLWFMQVGDTFDQLYLAITWLDLGNAMSQRDGELVYTFLAIHFYNCMMSCDERL